MSEHIVIATPFYPPHLGGVEQFSQGLARTLVQMGHRATVVTSREGLQPAREQTADGVRVVRLPTHQLLGGRFPLVRKRAGLSELENCFATDPPTGVLANTRFFLTTACVLEAARRRGLRAVVLDHGSAYIGFGIGAVDWAVRAYEHGVTRVVRRYEPDFYGVSQMSAEWLGHFGIEARGCIHNAIDAREFRDASSGRDFRAQLGLDACELLAVFTGRLVVTKGVWHVPDIARRLDEARAPVCLAVAGDGPERERLESSAPANMHVLGRLHREDVSALLQQADLFVFPSEYPEGMPTSIMEAGACGVSSIATNVGGVRELLPDEDHGIVHGVVDTAQWAREITWLEEHREELARRGARCRERIEREFSWERTARAVLDACVRAAR